MQKLQNELSNPLSQCRTNIAAHGRLNIPANFRKTANLKDGDAVMLTLQNDHSIKIQPLTQIIEEVQALVAEYFGDDDLMAEVKEMRQQDAILESKKFDIK